MSFEAQNYTGAMRRIYESDVFQDFKIFVAFLPHDTRKQFDALFKFFKIPVTDYERANHVTPQEFVSRRLNVLYVFIFPILFSSLLQRYAEDPIAVPQDKIVNACDQFYSILESYLCNTRPAHNSGDDSIKPSSSPNNFITNSDIPASALDSSAAMASSDISPITDPANLENTPYVNTLDLTIRSTTPISHPPIESTDGLGDSTIILVPADSGTPPPDLNDSTLASQLPIDDSNILATANSHDLPLSLHVPAGNIDESSNDLVLNAKFKKLLETWCKNKSKEPAGVADEIFTLAIQIFSLWFVSTKDTAALCILLNNYPAVTEDSQIIKTTRRLENLLSVMTYFTRQKISTPDGRFSLTARDTSPEIQNHGLVIKPLREYIGGNTNSTLLGKIFDIFNLNPHGPEDHREILRIIKDYNDYQKVSFNEYLNEALSDLGLAVTHTSASHHRTPRRQNAYFSDNETTSTPSPQYSLHGQDYFSDHEAARRVFLQSTQINVDRQYENWLKIKILLARPITSALQALARLRALANSDSKIYSLNEKNSAIKELYRKAKQLNEEEFAELEYFLKQPENHNIRSFIEAAPLNPSKLRGWNLKQKPIRTSAVSINDTSPSIVLQVWNFFVGYFTTCFQPHAEVANKNPPELNTITIPRPGHALLVQTTLEASLTREANDSPVPSPT